MNANHNNIGAPPRRTSSTDGKTIVDEFLGELTSDASVKISKVCFHA